MTTGVLLKALSDKDALAGVTHVVVDEVHERDRNSDFALILLRDLLPQRPDLRVVLMSATPQISLFSGYALPRRHLSMRRQLRLWTSTSRYPLAVRHRTGASRTY